MIVCDKCKQAGNTVEYCMGLTDRGYLQQGLQRVHLCPDCDKDVREYLKGAMGFYRIKPVFPWLRVVFATAALAVFTATQVIWLFVRK